MSEIYNQAKTTFEEIRSKIDTSLGTLLVIGCSTSTVLGDMPGTNSNEEIAGDLYRAASETFSGDFEIAVQCCEHLNRALVMEREVADKYGFTIVNAVPQKKAGGAFATIHYNSLKSPVVVEDVGMKAIVGIDIGGVMVGMHLRPTVVPMKIENRIIGKAFVFAGKSRLKYIGGERTKYL